VEGKASIDPIDQAAQSSIDRPRSAPCGNPFNETMIVEETDVQSLRDEVTTLREELKEVLKGYNELTKLRVLLTKEIHELKTGA
jgi:hypothetical protein